MVLWGPHTCGPSQGGEKSGSHVCDPYTQTNFLSQAFSTAPQEGRDFPLRLLEGDHRRNGEQNHTLPKGRISGYSTGPDRPDL